ncbi:MAG TPA: bZIP transcription factor [Bryobacteraceae bacterium]|nr:bZIP transcription factor [Bryobacteraceae bacterium]
MDNSQIIERLERLEKRNAELTEEVRRLREQLGALQVSNGTASAPPASQEDIVAMQQARIDEQAQSKVEAAHKLPLRITGMALFNAYYDTHSDAGLYSGIAASVPGRASAGGSLSESIVGLEFQSPNTVLGARVRGSIYADFFGRAYSGNDTSDGQWPTPRLRTGTITLDWKSRSVTVGVDKPLISPYSPDSFAQVGEPALSGAGNLWFWEPQARFEQRVNLPDSDTLRLQVALYSTYETSSYLTGEYGHITLERRRPGWEGRIELAHGGEDDKGYNIAGGFHFSDTHVGGETITSDLVSFDGRLRLSRLWNLTGTLFTGENLAGLGGSGPGFSIFGDYSLRGVHSSGGWLQLTLAPTDRLSFHFFGGAQDNRRRDLWGDAVHSNAAFAGNINYQLAPNVVTAFEAGRTRTDWTHSGTRARNIYDLSLAYLF